MWPRTGITVNVLKYCLNSAVDLAKASTVLMADVFAIESLEMAYSNRNMITYIEGRRAHEESQRGCDLFRSYIC